MARPPKKFVEFFVSRFRGHPPMPYYPRKIIHRIRPAEVAGIYHRGWEPTHDVKRTVSPKHLADIARKTGQDSIYAHTRSGSAYLVEPSGHLTRMTEVHRFFFPKLTSPMVEKIKETAPGGSLLKLKHGYELEIAAYPGAEKETEFAVGNIRHYFTGHGSQVRMERR